MAALGFLLQLIGFVLIAYVALDAAKFLFAYFPFRDKSSGWWWTKWIPLIGIGLVLVGFGEHIAVSVLGAALIAAAIAWVAYLSKKRI